MRYGLKLSVVFTTGNVNLKRNNIPWHNTNNIDKARKTLLAMYNHFDSESPVKAFLYFNSLHLTKELAGDTGVPKGYFDITRLRSEAQNCR